MVSGQRWLSGHQADMSNNECDSKSLALTTTTKLGENIVMVQLNEVKVHELKPKMLTKDKSGLVRRQTSN